MLNNILYQDTVVAGTEYEEEEDKLHVTKEHIQGGHTYKHCLFFFNFSINKQMFLGEKYNNKLQLIEDSLKKS